jgi:anti-sigma-K factor RskA
VSERGPDFEALVGSGLEADERERLRRVHELLVAAGPPPEAPARAPVVPLGRRRRRGVLLAVAAALAVASFALGVAVGGTDDALAVDFVVEMSSDKGGAAATLTVYELDEAGNWPMEMEVEGLAPAASGRPFELWLTRDGEPEAFCGSFATDGGGSARVPLNAPWRLDEFDGWIVVEEGSTAPLLST